jgi:hypothetical protein
MNKLHSEKFEELKKLLQFDARQIELIIASIAFTSFQLASSDNLAKTILDFDYAFEHFAFENPLDKRQLVNDPIEYTGQLLNPLIDALMDHYLLLHIDGNKSQLSESVSA